jgi:RHS repeat-associated protein
MGSTTINGATAISYQPMNLGMASWTSSNGLVNTMGYDTDGRLTGISVPGVQSLGFTYDNADRITQIGNGLDGTQTQYFGYDAMSRLVSVYSGVDNESFQYDANGNRLMQMGTTDTVSATSNQLLSSGTNQYGYDARGNTTTVNGTVRYGYDAFNRMNAAAGMAYYVNPEGQRLRKTGTAGTTYFAPDKGGSLMAENPNGAWVDYVWLNGRLIGRMAASQADAIDDDQVGRPQVVTDSGHNIVWQAQNLAFTQNVTTASITLNLGFPGQYYDAETAAWNNGFRDYKSGLGRYVESDPIGLGGGINTYAYAENEPTLFSDEYGLCKCKAAANAPSPQQYQEVGKSLSLLDSMGPIGYAPTLVALSSFHRGGALDAQVRYGASPAYANYVFGVTLSAEGTSLSGALAAANAYGAMASSYGKQVTMDPNYSYIPQANVQSITDGYNDQQNGTLCTLY